MTDSDIDLSYRALNECNTTPRRRVCYCVKSASGWLIMRVYGECVWKSLLIYRAWSYRW